MTDTWASDTPISMPEAPPEDVPVLVDFEGFGFSMSGIVHNVSGADLEELRSPHFAPEGYQGEQAGDDRLGITGDDIEVDDEYDPGEYVGAEYDIEVWD